MVVSDNTDPPMDLNGVKQMSGAFYSAFPDLKHDIQDMISEGDKVAIRMIVRGTHKGDFMGIAPTGKKVAIAAIGVGRIADGKLVEQWAMFDQIGLMQQIGAIPAPGHSGGHSGH